MTQQQLQHEEGTRVVLFSSEFRHLTACRSGLTIPLPYLAHILVGSSGLLGALLHHRSHNRHCYPLQKGMKSLRGLSLQPGEIMAKKKTQNRMVKTQEAQFSPGWGCPCSRSSSSALGVPLTCRVTPSHHHHWRLRTSHHLPHSLHI